MLTCDGPSLGGFVCPATILTTELWKMGQVGGCLRLPGRRRQGLARCPAQGRGAHRAPSPALRGLASNLLRSVPQVRPGDAVRFRQVTVEEAYVRRFSVDRQVGRRADRSNRASPARLPCPLLEGAPRLAAAFACCLLGSAEVRSR